MDNKKIFITLCLGAGAAYLAYKFFGKKKDTDLNSIGVLEIPKMQKITGSKDNIQYPKELTDNFRDTSFNTKFDKSGLKLAWHDGKLYRIPSLKVKTTENAKNGSNIQAQRSYSLTKMLINGFYSARKSYEDLIDIFEIIQEGIASNGGVLPENVSLYFIISKALIAFEEERKTDALHEKARREKSMYAHYKSQYNK
jgi:hypothetical protein